MKDIMLIDSNLPNNFLVDVMDIANYLQNQHPTIYISDKKTIIILKEK